MYGTGRTSSFAVKRLRLIVWKRRVGARERNVVIGKKHTGVACLLLPMRIVLTAIPFQIMLDG